MTFFSTYIEDLEEIFKHNDTAEEVMIFSSAIKSMKNFLDKSDLNYPPIEIQIKNPHKNFTAVMINKKNNIKNASRFLVRFFKDRDAVSGIEIGLLKKNKDYYAYEKITERKDLKIIDILALIKTLNEMITEILVKSI
jgi:hypothetical protein